jgi:copper oxidase (laccase) domain-containing protein
VPGTDALVTIASGIPIMLCFADCVPVILVAPGFGVAVAHAGWRGALSSIPGKAALELARVTGCHASNIHVYIGAHVRACHYPVSDELMLQFCRAFGELARDVSGGLELEAVVTASLIDAGVRASGIARLGVCTAEATDRFFSYRAEDGRTGRHSAFACIV